MTAAEPSDSLYGTASETGSGLSWSQHPPEGSSAVSITIADVAARAGVSKTTVSRVLNGKGELDARNSSLPVFVGGKLNRIPDGSNTSLPVDISEELASAGATVCRSVDSMIAALAEIARAPRPDTRR